MPAKKPLFGTLEFVGIGVGAVAGVMAFIGNVKRIAMERADKGNVFEDLRKERHDELTKAYNQPVEKLVDTSYLYPEYTQEFHEQVDTINHKYIEKKRERIHKLGLDSTGGSWKSLNDADKGSAIAFATITGVMFGVATYGIGAFLQQVSKSSGKGGGPGGYGGDNSAGSAGYFDFSGGDCGFGFGGGGDGGGGGCGL